MSVYDSFTHRCFHLKFSYFLSILLSFPPSGSVVVSQSPSSSPHFFFLSFATDSYPPSLTSVSLIVCL